MKTMLRGWRFRAVSFFTTVASRGLRKEQSEEHTAIKKLKKSSLGFKRRVLTAMCLAYSPVTKNILN